MKERRGLQESPRASAVETPAAPFSMLLPSAAEMAAFDSWTIERGVSGQALMERAGLEMTRWLCAHRRGWLQHVVILCGPGNNGGDGYVIGRLLAREGVRAVVLAPRSERRSALCAEQRQLFREVHGRELEIVDRASADDAKRHLERSTLVIDALLGTGQQNAPRDGVRELMELLEEVLQRLPSRPSIIAVDVPSGIDATTGEVFTPAIRASDTLTVEAAKLGMAQYPAREWCGEVHFLNIGLDCSQGTFFRRADLEHIDRHPRRLMSAHKGDFGHVLIVAGSRAMPGAGRLAAAGAVRSGAGLVTKCLFSQTAHSRPEIMLLHCGDEHGLLHPADVATIEQRLSEVSCVVIGPGLGLGATTGDAVMLLLHAIDSYGIPMVIDADGLNHLAHQEAAGTRFFSERSILTPHPGEMGRLLQIETREVQADRCRAARALQARYGGISVLKGAGTVVCDGESGTINFSGNPWMASGGMGDVLAGVIAGFVAQPFLRARLSMRQLVSLAVFVHGYAGDIVLRDRGGPVTAGDVVEALPQAIGSVVED